MLADIHKEPVGSQAIDAIVARRTSTPRPPEPPLAALDVHAPSVNQQLSLSFTCRPADFDRLQPRFRSWLATLTLARPPTEAASLSDRLWTPIVTGAIVGVVFILLYRHTRGRRGRAGS